MEEETEACERYTVNIAIIFHDADMDGKLSNEACRYHLSRIHPDAAIHSYGWDYGRPVPVPLHKWWDPQMGDQFSNKWEDYDLIYIVDLSVDALMERPDLREKIVWIDHHKSAISKWDELPDREGKPEPFAGMRIDGVAACRLCWAWFTWGKLPKGVLPSKQDYIPPLTKSVFIDREISEPKLIRLAGEYDIWDHRDPDAKALQFGLRALSSLDMERLVENQFDGWATGVKLDDVVTQGHAIKSYCDLQNNEYSAAYARTLQWEGLSFCCLNIGQRGNSDLLRGGLKLEHQACFAWRHTGDAVLVSLYHAPGHESLDLSEIAVRYGGGGHRGACGFRLTMDQLTEILKGVVK